jgi:hypothetical protein
MAIKFTAPKGCNCRSFMKEMLPQVNNLRKTLGLRRMSMGTFYVVRKKAAETWLAAKIKKNPRNAGLWAGNPYLATGRNGGYAFSQRNANMIVAAGVNYDLKKPRGRPVTLGLVPAAR